MTDFLPSTGPAPQGSAAVVAWQTGLASVRRRLREDWAHGTAPAAGSSPQRLWLSGRRTTAHGRRSAYATESVVRSAADGNQAKRLTAVQPRSSEYFSGEVRIDPLFQPSAPVRAAGAKVTFEPGARTAWHTHPLGQTLIVVSGVGLTQYWGKAPVVIRPGDVISCAPGEKHWHGASAGAAMSHIAIQEAPERQDGGLAREGVRCGVPAAAAIAE